MRTLASIVCSLAIAGCIKTEKPPCYPTWSPPDMKAGEGFEVNEPGMRISVRYEGPVGDDSGLTDDRIVVGQRTNTAYSEREFLVRSGDRVYAFEHMIGINIENDNDGIPDNNRANIFTRRI